MNQDKLQIYFFFILLGGALVLSFFIFYPYLYSLVLASIFAIVFKPIYYWLLAALGNRSSIAALTTILVVFLTVLAPLVFIGIQISQEAQQLYSYITLSGSGSIFTSLESFINIKMHSLLGPDIRPVDFNIDIDQFIKGGLTWIFQNVVSLLSSVTSITVSFFMFLFAFYYLLKDGHSFKKAIISLSPLADKYDEEISNKLEIAINSIVRGTLSVAIIQGSLTGFGFYLFGVPSPAFWGAVAAIAALIPGIGTALVIVPAVIYLFLADQVSASIGLSIWGAFAVGLIDNFLGPKLVQRGMKIHSFFILLFALGGLSFFGPIGFLLGPIMLSLLFALIHVYLLINKEAKA